MAITAFQKKQGLYFLLSMIGLVLFLIFLPEWCWVMFPFVGTSAILALDMI